MEGVEAAAGAEVCSGALLVSSAMMNFLELLGCDRPWAKAHSRPAKESLDTRQLEPG